MNCPFQETVFERLGYMNPNQYFHMEMGWLETRESVFVPLMREGGVTEAWKDPWASIPVAGE